MTKKVTIAGLGAMGSTMAAVYLDRGYEVSVWNRTASKTEPLVAKGAKAADSAATGELIVLSQVDYQSMYDSLGEADLTGKVLVNLSSDTPETLRRAAGWVRERGGELITGGIMVPPQGIGLPGAYAFYSGPEHLVEQHRAALEELGAVKFMGEDPGLAMAYYTASLHMFFSILAAFAHGAALVGDIRAFLPFAQETATELGGDGPMGYFKIFADEIEKGVYPGEFNNMHMMAVSMEHIVQASKDAGLDLATPAALSDLMNRTVEAGYAADGLSSIYEVIRPRSSSSTIA
ncbi:NAD(P)-binding domain-containing protein [Nonomuraea sp. NPDC050310]|uniref:NAD(P)-dependent oxidoreductase n=1 Tax=unclassified Nonomuraea TaxID=2593643 RepID=UPI0033F788CD